MASSKILVAFLPVVFSLLLQASQYLVEAFIRYQRCRNSLFFPLLPQRSEMQLVEYSVKVLACFMFSLMLETLHVAGQTSIEQ